jgi:hypothetical protein
MKTIEFETRSFLNRKLQNDDVFVPNRIVDLADVINMPTRRGLEKAIISGDTLVNTVSKSYGHLPNKNFFGVVEEKLQAEAIGYVTRSINRNNCSFAVDYILSDDNMVVNVKNTVDRIRPMLRFINSYDGKERTAGHLGFYREVCSNGLHVLKSRIGFSVKHRGNIVEVVLPEISSIVKNFMSNEFYDLQRKFNVLAERPIKDLEDFVKVTAENFKLFQFECSEKNPGPSLNARTVIETIERESRLLHTDPTLWIGYNAFNDLLHGKLKKTFGAQERLDANLFEAILSY